MGTVANQNPLLNQIIQYTAEHWVDGFVALYVYGSSVSGNPDAWSDLDLCLVWRDEEDTLLSRREWGSSLSKQFGKEVDPIGLPFESIGENSSWEFAFILRALQKNSRLLLGTDIRDRIVPPSPHKLLINAMIPPLVWVRILLSIPREQPLPYPLPQIEVSPERHFPSGNIAWAVANTYMHLLRGIVLLEYDIFCDDKMQIREELRLHSEDELAVLIDESLNMRQNVPRFDPLAALPDLTSQLAMMIPALAQRLLDALHSRNLEDPSWEPDHRSLYTPDGILKQDWRQTTRGQ